MSAFFDEIKQVHSRQFFFSLCSTVDMKEVERSRGDKEGGTDSSLDFKVLFYYIWKI